VVFDWSDWAASLETRQKWLIAFPGSLLAMV